MVLGLRQMLQKDDPLHPEALRVILRLARADKRLLGLLKGLQSPPEKVVSSQTGVRVLL